jgi:DNA invertase Pin-like site-specific DNA recombinase
MLGVFAEIERGLIRERCNAELARLAPPTPPPALTIGHGSQKRGGKYS